MSTWDDSIERRARRSASARKAGLTRSANFQEQKDAARVAAARERFDEQMQSAKRFSQSGGSSIGMPPGGYRAFAVGETDIFGGKWFGVFQGEVAGPFQTKTEIERAAEEHAFARGHGRGHAPEQKGGKSKRPPVAFNVGDHVVVEWPVGALYKGLIANVIKISPASYDKKSKSWIEPSYFLQGVKTPLGDDRLKQGWIHDPSRVYKATGHELYERGVRDLPGGKRRHAKPARKAPAKRKRAPSIASILREYRTRRGLR